MSSKIKIILDNYHGQCYPGTVISGRLECYFAKPKKFREITIKCEGKETTSWTESESYRDEHNRQQTRHQTYTGDHNIYLNKICLAKLQNNEEVAAGKYFYPFSFLLPENLPSTYDCEYGHIIYTIKAVVNRPWKFDYESEIAIIVVSPIDLNKIPHAKNSVTLSDEKDVCCFWCKSGPISITITVPHSGFAPGESVYCPAYIQNLSNINVKGIDLDLIQTFKYQVEFPSTKTKSTTNRLARACYGTIGAHGEHNFTLELTVPENVVIPNFSICKLFKAEYALTMEVRLPCPHVNLNETVAVIMGNIKFNFSSQNPGLQLPTPSAPLLGIAAPVADNTILIRTQETIASTDPPTYDEAVQAATGSVPMPMPPLPVYEVKY